MSVCRWNFSVLRLLGLWILVVGWGAVHAVPIVTGSWEHAISTYVAPKYGKDFKHFDYVNPDAPKGGLLRLANPDRRTSIDKLNPFTKEIYAFPDKGGIVPVVGVDGWARIINEHPAFDGMDFNDGPADKAGAPEWIECVMYRKDRTHPTKVRERMSECRRSTPPWQSHPTRMLRHKAMIQCARIAFGFAGIYDEDEAERIIERDMGKATVAQDPTNKLAPRAKAPTDQPPTPPAGETTAASPAAQASTSQPDVPPRPATAPTVGDGGADPSNAAAPADLAAEGTPTADKSGPGSTDAAAPILLAPSQRAILEKRMKAAEITAADVHKKFGKGLEFITVEEFQAVAAFIANPAGK